MRLREVGLQLGFRTDPKDIGPTFRIMSFLIKLDLSMFQLLPKANEKR